MYLKRKYAIGGIAYTPYVSDSAPRTAQQTQPQEDKSTATITKEIAGILKENGIPVDVELFLNTADNFLNKSRYLSNSSLFGGSVDYSLADLIKVQKLANDVKYNRALRDEAEKQINKEYAGSEVALTNTGKIYAYNAEGNIVQLNPNEYYENQDEYEAITNNQLMYLRDHSKDFAFNTSVLNDLATTVGMPTIMKQVVDTIKKFGTDKLDGYTTKNANVNNGLRLLMEGGPDGYYKFETEEQLRDVNRALTYLYRSLPKHAQNVLKAKTAAEGGDPSNGRDVTNLIFQALAEHTSRKTGVDFDKSATEYDPMGTGKKGGSKDPADSLAQDTYQIRFAEGRGIPTQILLAPTASKIFDTATMLVKGTDFGPMEDWNNKQLGQMNLPKLLKEWALGTSVRNADITFGNKVLDYSELPTIMYDGQSLTTAVYLPYDKAVFEQTGKYTPDFNLFRKFNEFNAAAKDLSGVERNTLMKKYGFSADDIALNPETGGFTLKNTMRFVTFSAYAGDDTLSLDDTNKLFLEKVPRQKGKTIVDPYNKALKYNDIYADTKKGIILNNGYTEADSWDFWRGNVFIAAPSAFYGYNSSSNQYKPKETFMDVDKRVQANQMMIDAFNYVRENDPDYLTKTKIGQFRNE